MGLRKSYIDFINRNITSCYGQAISGLKMLELGDQVIKKKSGISESTGKEYFTNRGFFHISVDLNGQRGALVKDLTNHEDFLEWPMYFDIVTNSGTTEHVEPFESQYDCFEIIHNCTKIGGLMIHIVPDILSLEAGQFVNHCNYYYSEKFFNELAVNSNYSILENIFMDNLRCVALIKNTVDFVNKEAFLKNITKISMENTL
jgi:hypothetical protein